ncbi:SDR family NAD(P)-dependent oxidoreductase [Sphingomonas sp. AP4-R1]|uniref:SDR family NAD(P)-dependent oxidoreductase n=1 Tax=Sphingomonas sp. AP4-R1 TaxID=2735134 RepID=UPI0014934C25|nr:SDR family NAD(P)-dependent oxidoreductase [Sphingomonas sp. AP4-R1]QJU58249.1 SDR family NAD(P)-dependent oxidoreductase [Sphingomonas sp. AP4-R1]
MSDKLVALVTGANKGIGHQIGKDLAAKGYKVLVGSRDLAAGEEAASAIGGDAEAIQIDVADRASIAAAAASIADRIGRLDVLVNNAGIAQAGPSDRRREDVLPKTRISAVDLDELRRVFDTNAFGTLSVTQAMLPLLRAAPAGRIVNISSGNASLTWNAHPSSPHRAYVGAYTVSKVALNAMTQALAFDLKDTAIKVNAVCPGFTATAINGFAGTGTVEEAAREPVRLATLGPDGPSGGFTNSDGTIPW